MFVKWNLAELRLLPPEGSEAQRVAERATLPMFPQALAVLAAWGFAYKTCFVWLKDRIGTYWNRNKNELLLVGTRGRIPAPAPGTQWDSQIDVPAGRHSEKPENLIEAYYPHVQKIEQNTRAARDGWDRSGAESSVTGRAVAIHPRPTEDPYRRRLPT